MHQLIERLDRNADRRAVTRWLRRTIRAIGPGFHVDTPPGTYVDESGRPSLSRAEAGRLASGLKIAARTLGQPAFEDLCLREVWKALGVRYDRARDSLVPCVS